MTPPAYANRSQFYAFGARRGLVGDERRSVEVDLQTSRFSAANHGLVDGDALQFVVEDPSADTLPVPLSVATVYRARLIENSSSLFEVALDVGSPAVVLTGAGAGRFGFVVDLGPAIDDALESYSRFVDDKMPANKVPFTAPFPSWLAIATATLAARSVLGLRGLADEDLISRAETVLEELETRRRGMYRTRDPRATGGTNKAVSLRTVIREYEASL